MLSLILRLGLLGINVMDSFKVMKAPKARKGHAPSERAVAARKRDMKGLLCVWLVCACWLKLESVCDRTVVYLMPFYGNVKTMCFLYLIFGRSSAAEPIFTKYIRPTIKPYSKTIDSILELLSMLAAFAGELAAVPLHALKHRWEAFNDATNVDSIAEDAAETAGDDAPLRGRNRRFSVFSFWKDNNEATLELGVEPAGDDEEQEEEHSSPPDDDDIGEQELADVTAEEPIRKKTSDRRSANSSTVSRAEKPLPPAPAPGPSRATSSRPRLGYVPAAMPSYERHASPSQQSQQAEILQTDTQVAETDRMRNVARQANEVYEDVERAQEKVRDRARTVGNRDGLRRREPQSSGSSSTRQARPINGRTTSSSSSTHQQDAPVFKEPIPPTQQPRISRSPPGTSYIPAPPPAELHGQSSFGENASWGYRRNPSAGCQSVVNFPGHMSPPPSEHPYSAFPRDTIGTIPTGSYASAIAMLQPQPQNPGPMHPPTNIPVNAYVNSPAPPSDPFERARRRPPPIKPVLTNDHEDNGEEGNDEDEDEVEDEDGEEEPFPIRNNFRPATPPSQYLGPLPSARTVENTAQLALEFPSRELPPKTPMAPGGFGQWDLNSEVMGNSEYDDDGEVGPDDSISVRGAHRPAPPIHAFFAPPSQTQPVRQERVASPLGRPRKGLTLRGIDTRPTTVNDFEQMRLELEAEEATTAAGIREVLDGRTVAVQTPLPAKNRKSRLSTHLPGYFPLTPAFPPPPQDAHEIDENEGQIVNLGERPSSRQSPRPQQQDRRAPLPALGIYAEGAEEEQDNDLREFGARNIVQTGNVKEVEEALPVEGSSSKSEIKRLKKVIEEALAGKDPIQLPSQQFDAPVSRQRPAGEQQPVNARHPRPKALHVQPSAPPAEPGPLTGGTGASKSRRGLQTIEESVSVSLGDSLRGGKTVRSSEDGSRPTTADSKGRSAVPIKAQPWGPIAPSEVIAHPRSTKLPQLPTSSQERGSAAATGSTGGATVRGLTRARPTISQKRSSSDIGREDNGGRARTDVMGRNKDEDEKGLKKRRVASTGEAQQQNVAMPIRSVGRHLRSNGAGHIASGSSSIAGSDIPTPMVLSGGRHVKSPTEHIPDESVDEVGQIKTRRRKANATQ
ncbi:hypothetical protein FRB97_001010 [Tulasnella sp. 331]|nr:hypothetical protein FRB97_001010 [Tulasnella sp. 331]